jgi:hypothetical protein
VTSPALAQKTVWAVAGRDPAGYDSDTLKWMANGPLHDAARAFCPAGKLSWAETRAREAAQLRAAS